MHINEICILIIAAIRYCLAVIWWLNWRYWGRCWWLGLHDWIKRLGGLYDAYRHFSLFGNFGYIKWWCDVNWRGGINLICVRDEAY